MDGQQFALVAAAEEGRAATAHKLLLAVQQKGGVWSVVTTGVVRVSAMLTGR